MRDVARKIESSERGLSSSDGTMRHASAVGATVSFKHASSGSPLNVCHVFDSAPHTFLSLHTASIMQVSPERATAISPLYIISPQHRHHKQSNVRRCTVVAWKRLVLAPKLLVCPKQALSQLGSRRFPYPSNPAIIIFHPAGRRF